MRLKRDHFNVKSKPACGQSGKVSLVDFVDYGDSIWIGTNCERCAKHRGKEALKPFRKALSELTFKRA